MMPAVSVSHVDEPPITHYDRAGRDAALLRWSLWTANDGRCYLCSENRSYVFIQVDHLIPKHLEHAEFNEVWKRVAGGLPNLGPHHISNLRAICSDCNSSRLKGSKVLADGYLSTQLLKSPALSALAFKEQARMRRNRAVGESAVKVTSASGDEDYRVLWETELSQAIMGTLHIAADVVDPSQGTETRVQADDLTVFVRTSMTPNGARLMGAVQLVSGVPLVTITESLIPAAVEVVAESHREFAESTYPDLRGANSGDADWLNAVFVVTWDSATIDEKTCVCKATVSVEGEVSAPVSLQSPDGSELGEDTGPDCTIDGFAYFEVIVGVGDGVYDVTLQDHTLRPNLADALPA